MRPPGRPKGEYRNAQHEGTPVRPPGRPKGDDRNAQHEGTPVTSLLEDVARAFAKGGALDQADPHYVEREVQQRMARDVAIAIDGRTALVAEAGTGVGKTFAYLVPTLLSGKRALISTATKSCDFQRLKSSSTCQRARYSTAASFGVNSSSGTFVTIPATPRPHKVRAVAGSFTVQTCTGQPSPRAAATNARVGTGSPR